eukprot:GHVP01060834.1.p1 GENE.GHVP01060834.1~~GHVP01060834.1.p1  ORF type:complete len:122 (+),score=13.53 GHVP01060834.1:36-401(+)
MILWDDENETADMGEVDTTSLFELGFLTEFNPEIATSMTDYFLELATLVVQVCIAVLVTILLFFGFVGFLILFLPFVFIFDPSALLIVVFFPTFVWYTTLMCSTFFSSSQLLGDMLVPDQN